jgi:hypothetical protein
MHAGEAGQDISHQPVRRAIQADALASAVCQMGYRGWAAGAVPLAWSAQGRAQPFCRARRNGIRTPGMERSQNALHFGTLHTQRQPGAACR